MGNPAELRHSACGKSDLFSNSRPLTFYYKIRSRSLMVNTPKDCRSATCLTSVEKTSPSPQNSMLCLQCSSNHEQRQHRYSNYWHVLQQHLSLRRPSVLRLSKADSTQRLYRPPARMWVGPDTPLPLQSISAQYPGFLPEDMPALPLYPSSACVENLPYLQLQSRVFESSRPEYTIGPCRPETADLDNWRCRAAQQCKLAPLRWRQIWSGGANGVGKYAPITHFQTTTIL